MVFIGVYGWLDVVGYLVLCKDWLVLFGISTYCWFVAWLRALGGLPVGRLL